MSFFHPCGDDPDLSSVRYLRRIGMKPTIRCSFPRADGPRWVCVGLGHAALGYTPSDAYNNWTRGFRNGRQEA